MKVTKLGAVGVVFLALVPAATAKDFDPGDLRVCAANRCRPIKNQRVLNGLSAFYYGSVEPNQVRAPMNRAPSVELRFRNGYVTGVAAGIRFDFFLSFGVNLGQFAARRWYVIPVRASAEIKRLAAQVRPRPLPRNVLERSY